MSVTGHNDVRHPDDFYATPSWCTRAILPVLSRLIGQTFCEPDRIIDPCCGDGAILDVVAEVYPTAFRCGVEIDPVRAAKAASRHNVVAADALGPLRWTGNGDLVLTNPPFSLAMEFVQRAIKEAGKGGTVAMLLRLPWLASMKRAAWLRANTPSVYVLPKRPSFTGNGKSDATDYAWMVWDRRAPTVAILEVA